MGLRPDSYPDHAGIVTRTRYVQKQGAEERIAELLAASKRGRHVELGPSVDRYVEALRQDDFFEEDEPVADAIAAFEAAGLHLTEEPSGTGWCAPSP